MMYYTIYKITNKLNNKFYIGKHKTNDLDDGYMGSGTLLQRAYQKYGTDNFTKEIILLCESETEMNLKEKELVVVDPRISYNLTGGGYGNWNHINKNNDRYKKDKSKGRKAADAVMDEKYGEHWRSDIGKIGNTARQKKYPSLSHSTAMRGHNEGWFSFKGKKHTEETLALLKQAHKDIHAGERNSQYGTCWIHNAEHNKKIKKEELDNYLNIGYIKGRKMSLHR